MGKSSDQAASAESYSRPMTSNDYCCVCVCMQGRIRKKTEKNVSKKTSKYVLETAFCETLLWMSFWSLFLSLWVLASLAAYSSAKATIAGVMSFCGMTPRSSSSMRAFFSFSLQNAISFSCFSPNTSAIFSAEVSVFGNDVEELDASSSFTSWQP